VSDELAALEALPLYLTVAEAAEQLNVNPRTIWRLVERGELDLRRIGRAARIPRSSLVSYLGLEAGGNGADIVSILPNEKPTD
jgi:excisionase family DNA binding protein